MENGKLETVPPGTVHLDTVRSLHQTVVSLRTALEVSKNELKELKEKYQEHSRCIDYTDVLEKLALENHILRRKILDSGYGEKDPHQNINLEVSYSPKPDNSNTSYDSEVVINTFSTEKDTRCEDSVKAKNKSVDRLEEILEESKSESIDSEILNFPNATSSPDIGEPYSEVNVPKDHSELNNTNFKTKLELLSKFDVKIKVRSHKEGSVISSTTSDSESTLDEKKEKPFKKPSDLSASFKIQEHREHFENLKHNKGEAINIKTSSTENIRMAVPNEAEVKSKADKFDVQVRITSEDNFVVKESTERAIQKDTLNLDVDNLSIRSMSDGDNSVFSEDGTITTPLGHNTALDEKQDQENASGNESEEVDDIELIFTTDESRDISNLQEDLVPIRETDNWAPASASTHSTPVLIKFHTLDPDFQRESEIPDARRAKQEKSSRVSEPSLRMKRVSLPNDKEIRHVGFTEKGSLDLPSRGILKSCENKSDNTIFRRSPNASTRRLDSVDSLTGEYYRGLSFDNTKSSSFELGSSLDVLHREESVDSFYKPRMGHRFSVFAETDISKCGISEDDLASNLNMRRNTCPNPFAYRPLSRGGSRTSCKPVGRPRPIIYQGYAPRRENSAQTDMSALPPRWTSDGYLAYKMPSTAPPIVPTLPQRTTAARRLTVPDARPAPTQRRTDEARRVLLSDIGFTSMVPELSRSAEPLWTLRRTPAPVPESPCSPNSRYRFRSPCISVDRSNDWTQTNTSSKGVSWRRSLPDVRGDDTDELLLETEAFLRRSIDDLQTTLLEGTTVTTVERAGEKTGHPYIPAEARQLRLGHAVKLITPQGRLAVGRVRYVGLAGGTAAKSGIMIGAEFSVTQYPGLPRNDGTYQGRRYFLTPPQYTALFVPFSKVVMAWAN